MPEPAPERANKLVIRKIIPVPREKVFAAWLDPEGMRGWMCPGSCRSAEVEIDARVGGKFRILMKSEEKDYDHTGEYVVIDPPSKLAFTWISEGTDHQATLVTVELFDRGKECELVLTHERFPRPEKVEPHRQGWGSIVEKLAAHLEAASRR
jgi:uncharacterized protein YndB with AHSA1/START domain